MKPYFEMKRSAYCLDLIAEEQKVQAETREIKKHLFEECGCISRTIRETAVDQRVLELVQHLGKTEVTLLSVGSGALGQEYHINKRLIEHDFSVQWLLVDKDYGSSEKSWALIESFKKSMEEHGSNVLGAYSDISGYAAFKLGKSEFCRLNRSDTHKHLFTEKWIDLAFNDVPLNSKIFNYRYQDFQTKPLPAVDLVLAIDLNPGGIAGYKRIKALNDLTLEAANYLDPEAASLWVINTNPLGARDEADLEIGVFEPGNRCSNQRLH